MSTTSPHKKTGTAYFPQSTLDSIEAKGHYYAAPVDIHMPAWFFYSKPAFQKAGITAEPQTYDEFIADLGKLKAAGIIPLAFGGQPRQEKITFDAVLADVGGPDLYLKVYRDHDANAVKSDAFKKYCCIQAPARFRRPGSPGRNWNDATALVISARPACRSWAIGRRASSPAAKQSAGKGIPAVSPSGPHSPYLVAGDVFVFRRAITPPP